MNIRPRAGETRCPDKPEHPPTQARFARAYFLPWGCSCPRLTGAAFGQPKEQPELCPSLPTAERRSAAAVEAYNHAHPAGAAAPLSRCGCWRSCSAADDVCQRSQRGAVGCEGVSRKTLPAIARAPWSRPASLSKAATGHGRSPTPTASTLPLGEGA